MRRSVRCRKIEQRSVGMKKTSLWIWLAVYALVLFILYYEYNANHVYYAYSIYLHVAVLLLGIFAPVGWEQWRILMLGLAALGIVFHVESMDTPGVRTVDIGSTQVLQPTSDSPADYMERTLCDGTEYKGRARFFKNGIFRKLDFDGAVTVIWPDGDCLYGRYEKGKLKSGRLVLKEEKLVYDGELRENIAWPRVLWLQGQGILYTDSALCLAGTFSKGDWGHQGTIYGKSGRRVYETCHADGSYSHVLLSEQDAYVGRFRKGTLTGYGRFYYKDGGYYQGFFKDGKFTGTGTLYGADGKQICVGFGNDVHPFSLPELQSRQLAESRRSKKALKGSSETLHQTGVRQRRTPDRPKDDGKKGETAKERRAKQNATSRKEASYDADFTRRKKLEDRLDAQKRNGKDIAQGKTAIERRRAERAFTIPPPRDKEGKIKRTTHDEFHPLSDPPGREITSSDHRNGYLCVSFENGDIYTGYWRNGLRHGHGKMNYTNGDIYEGDWVDGHRTGQGVYLTAERQRYKGSFVDGELHGPAVHYDDPTRKIVYNGRWEHGKSVPKK